MALDKTDQFLSKSITGSVVEFSDDDDELISDFLGGIILRRGIVLFVRWFPLPFSVVYG